MKKELTSTGCLGVNDSRDLQPVKTPEGNEYVVKLGIFGTKDIQGRHVHALPQSTIDRFNKRRNLIGVPTSSASVPNGLSSTDGNSPVCAIVKDVKTLPFGDKQIVLGVIRPHGRMSETLEKALSDPSSCLKFGYRASVKLHKVDGNTEVEIVDLHGFNLIG